MQLGPMTSGIVTLLLISVILGVPFAASRYGPCVDEKLVHLVTRKRLHLIAKWISWTMCAFMSALAILGWGDVVYGKYQTSIILYIYTALVITHAMSMIKKGYTCAYRCASGEAIVVLAFFGGVLYGNPEGGPPPLMNVELGAIGFWIWVVGSSAIVTAAWICHRAANDLRKRKKTKSRNFV